MCYRQKQMMRQLIAAQVATLEYFDTDHNDHEKAAEHLEEIETCLKEAGKTLKQMIKDDK